MKVPEPRKLKSGTWFIQLRLNGVSVPVTALTAKECKRQAELIKAEHRAEKRVIRNGKEQKTLREMMAAYIDRSRPVLSPSTVRGYVTVMNNRFPGYADKKPEDIADWQEVINDEVRTGMRPKTIKNSWALLTAAMSMHGIEAPDVKLPAIEQTKRPWLDPEEINKFLEALRGEKCEIPALLALHSLRRSEIMGLSWDKIILNKGIIRIEGSAVFNDENTLIRKKTNKTSKSKRDIPIMIPRLKELLESAGVTDVTSPIVSCNPNTLWARINRVCEHAGLPKVGVHGLRHSFASLAFSSDVGMTEREVMEIGGWDDYNTVHKIYEHLAKKNRLKAENKMARFYSNSKENANENAN